MIESVLVGAEEEAVKEKVAKVEVGKVEEGVLYRSFKEIFEVSTARAA